MATSTKHEYSSLKQEDSVSEEKFPDRNLKASSLRPALSAAVLGMIATAVGFALGTWATALHYTVAHEEGPRWTQDLPVLKRVPTQFNGSFEFTGPYRGPPSSEIDKAWDRFTFHPMIDGTASLIAVDAGDIARANLTSEDHWVNSTVEYGEVNGGGYMATLEVFHQLHCLNMLRKAVHGEYYEEWRQSADGSFPWLKITHLDHCIEILRQVLSCHSDTGLITFHWVKDNPTPYPDFNTWHQCRNPEELLAWSQAREAPYHKRLSKDWFPDLVERPTEP